MGICKSALYRLFHRALIKKLNLFLCSCMRISPLRALLGIPFAIFPAKELRPESRKSKKLHGQI
jgi:hypothetical protein